MSNWTGFYSGFLSHLQKAIDSDSPIDSDRLRSLAAENPKNETHIEFFLVALLACKKFSLISDTTNSNCFKEFLRGRYSTNNWRLMARIIERDGNLSELDALRFLRKAQTKKGLLLDAPGDESTQYHCYQLMLIIIFLPKHWVSEELSARIAKAIGYVVKLAKRCEPFSKGRGKFQLFGYTSCYIALKLAEINRLDTGPDDTAELLDYCGWVLNNSTWKGPEIGSGALFNCSGNFHHGYNSLEDYPSFSLFWSTFLRLSSGENIVSGSEPPKSAYVAFSPSLLQFFLPSSMVFLSYKDLVDRTRFRERILEKLFLFRRRREVEYVKVSLKELSNIPLPYGLNVCLNANSEMALVLSAQGTYVSGQIKVYGAYPEISSKGSCLHEVLSSKSISACLVNFHLVRRAKMEIKIG